MRIMGRKRLFVEIVVTTLIGVMNNIFYGRRAITGREEEQEVTRQSSLLLWHGCAHTQMTSKFQKVLSELKCRVSQP
jgi:hypothetical protein